MNQILDHSGPKKQKAPSNTNDIKKIIKVFAIIILIFGIALIGTGAYALKQNSTSNTEETVEKVVEPTITAVLGDDSRVTISVEYSTTIETVSYRWDDGESTTSKASSQQTTMEIDGIGAPTGTHTLTVTVVDINKQNYEKEFTFEVEEGIDTIDPTIDVVTQRKSQVNWVQITAEDETELQYMTYTINDGDTSTVYPDENGDATIITATIEVEAGTTNSLKVTAVDTSNNAYTKDYSLTIYQAPTVTFDTNDTHSEVYVNVSSEQAIRKIVITLNDASETIELTDQYEYSGTIPITQVGNNIITVDVYTADQSDDDEPAQSQTGQLDYEG